MAGPAWPRSGFLIVAVGSVYVRGRAVPLLLGVAGAPRRFRRASTRLAVSNLRREPRRSAVMAVALGFAMGVGFITASFKDSVTEAITDAAQRQPRRRPGVGIDPNNSATDEARLGPEVLAGPRTPPRGRPVERGAFVVTRQRGRLS